MPELVTDAIVLRRVDYGEADLILTLLTRDGGKVSALARAARKSRKRFGGALGTFTISHVDMSRRPRSDMWTLRTASPRTSFAALAADVVALAHASYATELVRELSAPEVVDPDMFELLASFYRVVEAGGHPPLLRAFELKLLRIVGIEPDFDVCARCGREAAGLEAGAVFDPAMGGCVCRTCAAQSRGLGVRPLSGAALARLAEYARVGDLHDARELDPAADGALDARETLLAVVQSHLSGPLKSLEFVNKMRAGPR